MEIDINKLKVCKLSPIYDLSIFDCGDNDLNEFLREDALKHQNSLIATTLLFIYEEKIIGYASLCSDSVKLIKEEKLKIRDEIGYKYGDYPAVKVARLAVQKEYQGKDVGTKILNYIVGSVVFNSEKIASRFLTVDAYLEEKVINFYEKYGFEENTHELYKGRKTKSMRYDLYL